MLELLLGTDWVANRDMILQRAKQNIQKRENGVIVLVPELISHDMERRLCTCAGDTASRYAEVLTFTRLASRVAENAGYCALQCMDNGGRVVAMAAAARQLHSKLKAYASVETKPEFLSGLLDAVDEFKRCCITAQDLKDASLKSEGAFAQKLEELSLLLEAYDSICARGKRDPGDQMNWVLEQLESNTFAQDHIFYIDGFPDFTRQHFAVLEHFISNSTNVTVSLTCDKPGSRDMAFEKAGHTAAELIQYAENKGIAYRITIVDPRINPLRDFRKNLFQGQLCDTVAEKGALNLYRTDSVYDECQNAASIVMELVRSGVRYRQIGIVCTDMNAYQHPLNVVLSRCGIPMYRSGTEDILQNTVISTALSAIEAALGGFERQDIFRYLKSKLSPLDMDTVDRIENYTIMWGINGKRWTEPWQWHPNGLGMEFTEESAAQLNLLEEARQRTIKPLAELRNCFRNAKILDDQVNAIRNFFDTIGFADHLCQLADQMDSEGDNRSAQILNQLWEILLGALDQLQDVLGETVWDPDAFLHLLTLLLSQYDVGTIPPVLDAVTLGPVNTMRCHQVSHLIILGAHEGAFPGYTGSKGILTDQEREALRSMGVSLTGGGMEGMQAEFADIYGLFCAADVSVSVSFCNGQPSYIYRRLLSVSGEEKTAKRLISPDPKDIAASLVEVNDRISAEKLSLVEQYDSIAARRQYRLGKITDEHIRKLYGHSLRLSASQVDRQAECRFSYFLNYGLRAKERKELTVDPAEFGTYVHAVLENTAKEVMSLGGFHEVSLEQTNAIAKKYSEIYAKERFSDLDSKRISYLFQRNAAELDAVVMELWDELSKSLFEPAHFELGFGDGKSMPAISISGEKMNAVLRGYVDRVDIWRRGSEAYFRVVDYKTGSKDFDYCDVFNGVGLQMLLYLFALEEKGQDVLGNGFTSAGVQYFPARSPIVPSKGKPTAQSASKLHADHLKRKGLLLADMDVLTAMDPEDGFQRLCCKISKDGTLQGDIATHTQLNMLREYVFRFLGNLVDEIASGTVEPNPYVRGIDHGICSWCPYKSVCHYLQLDNRRLYKSMTAQRFWEEIGKEIEHHG